ncbi:MAG: hypothetical protein U0528_01960 [Anaerolineae bacterium]
MYHLRRHPVITAILSFIIGILLCRGIGGLFASAGSVESLLLRENERVQGDLTAVAKIVDVRDGSAVDGDTLIVAVESARIGGHIAGDLTVLASGIDVYLLPGLQVAGDLSICARSINGLNRAAIGGEINTGCDQLGVALSRYGAGNVSLGIPGFNLSIFLPFFRGYENIFQVLLNAVVIAGLAGLFATLLPAQYQRIVNTIMKASVPAGVLGLLTMGAMVVITVIYAVFGIVTLGLLLCLGLPIMGVFWLVINIALIVGWIGVSFPVGAWLMARLNLDYSRIKAAMIGAGALTLVQGILSLLPCVGFIAWLALLLIGSVGLGSVILTRGGLRPYPEVIQIELEARL